MWELASGRDGEPGCVGGESWDETAGSPLMTAAPKFYGGRSRRRGADRLAPHGIS